MIVTISDDLDVFESQEKAERYLEPWILETRNNFRAYDENGNVLRGFNFSGNAVKLVPVGESNKELLRNEIVRYIPRLGVSVNSDELSNMPLEDLIKFLLKYRGLTE
ncbi:hypothetical protein [Bdellovibrio sp. HCB-110]|uniref:hypothetical protein n=1 Tax=Bdellovibrio sp. HCB-110 TaxID=3391182 RepID=UPI0039B4EED2